MEVVACKVTPEPLGPVDRRFSDYYCIMYGYMHNANLLVCMFITVLKK
jgi:hypothetical protein